MKKAYEKPAIIFEDFSLSTSIAAGCEFINDLQSQGTCGYPTRNGIIFTTEITGCKYHESDVNDSLCYHVPSDDYNIFNS